MWIVEEWKLSPLSNIDRYHHAFVKVTTLTNRSFGDYNPEDFNELLSNNGKHTAGVKLSVM